MAPVEPRIYRDLPDLHLHVTKLNSRGSQLIFEHVNLYKVLTESCHRVLEALYPANLKDAQVPAIRSISLFLKEDRDGVAETHSSELDVEHKEIVLSLRYLQDVYERSGRRSRRLKEEIEGVLTHELVHVFQYDGSSTMPGGVIEGIADYVRASHGLRPPHWQEGPSPNAGWDVGYQTTAFFFLWLERRFDNPLLIPELNGRMRTTVWTDKGVLEDLLKGEPIKVLWEEYQKTFNPRTGNA